MGDDDERPTKPSSRLTILPLDDLSVDELDAYVAELRSEAERAQAAIARKRSHRSAADAVFGRRTVD